MKTEAVLKKERTFKVVSNSEKLKKLAPEELEELEEDALTTIQLSLSDEVLREFSQVQTVKDLGMLLRECYTTSLSLTASSYSNNFIPSK